MDRAEALRSIQHDLFEYIHKKVTVEFDNASQQPTSFYYSGKPRLVNEVLCRFRLNTENITNAFLIKVDDGDVYLLYFQIISEHPCRELQAGFWVLNIRILKDNELMALYLEDRKMLINITLNRVVNFHGHMCPDLILGGKVCEYAQKLLDGKDEYKNGLSVIAENCTSALDAIQVLLGVTVGNQRLRVMDYGKHNYTILYAKGKRGLRLTMRQVNYHDAGEYKVLLEKVADHQADINDVVQLQKLLDDRSKYLLGLHPEDIFHVEDVNATEQYFEMSDIYLSCCKCGQQVLKTRIVAHQGSNYCMPCFQKTNTGSIYRNLQ
jgi:formylmethanofuran dehydrogenase subunit E